MRQRLPPPELEHVCDLEIAVGQPLDIGLTAAGLRRVIPIIGGTVSGPLIMGRVLPGGADFQLILEEGRQSHLDARYVIELDDGSRIFVQNTALRVTSAQDALRLHRGEPVDPTRVYFRCQPRLEAAGANWSWLGQSQFVGTGQRAPNTVFLSFYRVV